MVGGPNFVTTFRTGWQLWSASQTAPSDQLIIVYSSPGLNFTAQTIEKSLKELNNSTQTEAASYHL